MWVVGTILPFVQPLVFFYATWCIEAHLWFCIVTVIAVATTVATDKVVIIIVGG